MGHACEILTFDGKESKAVIQAKCDEWGDYNCDLRERGGFGGGLGHRISFTEKIFDNYRDAEKYLNGTFGNYAQTAVRYRTYPGLKKTKAYEKLIIRLIETQRKLNKVKTKPHYQGVKQASVKCRKCGSVLATAFCGRSYTNRCPVCGNELRPASVLEKISRYEQNIRKLREETDLERRKAEKKAENKTVLRWAVACEVHC